MGTDILQPAPGKRVFHRENGGRKPGTSLHPPHSARARQPPPLDPKALMLSLGEGGTTTPRIYARTSGARRPGSPLHPAGFVRSVSPPKSPEAAPVLTPEGRRRVYWRGIAAERQPGSALHPESPRLSRSVSPMPRGRGGGGLPEATLERGGSLPGRNGPEESGGQRYYTSWGARKPGSPIHLSPPRMEGSGVSFPRALHWKPISSCLLKVSHHPHKHATLWPVTYARMCLHAYTKANTGMTSRTPEIGGNGGRKSHVQGHQLYMHTGVLVHRSNPGMLRY